MAFVVEDGTGLPNSNSYADVIFADEYFADRGNKLWPTYFQEDKQSFLVLGTDYINFRWCLYFRGFKTVDGQALEFPRTLWQGVPVNLKKATAEYALRASIALLAPDPEQDPSGYQVSRRIEKIGPIEDRVDFAFLGPGAVRQLVKPYPSADFLLLEFFGRGQGQVIRN